MLLCSCSEMSLVGSYFSSFPWCLRESLTLFLISLSLSLSGCIFPTYSVLNVDILKLGEVYTCYPIKKLGRLLVLLMLFTLTLTRL